MNEIHVWPEGIRAEGASAQLSAVIETGDQRQTLWYRVPEEFRPRLTDSADPFVLAIFHWAMTRRGALKVHGSLSPSLLTNLDELQSIWITWKPEAYSRIDIIPDQAGDAVRAGTPAAIVAFSGGVDSCYTVWRHHQKRVTPWSPPIKSGLMIHGFDIPLERPEGFAVALKKSGQLLNDLGIGLIPLATNYRSLPHRWEDCFSAATAAAMSVLQRNFTVGLIGSGRSYADTRIPWGSTPATDPLLSSAALKIVHDGADASRIDKVKALTEWPAALRLLRVCWAGPTTEKNCCVCEKCVRTMLEFRAVSGEIPPAFEQGLTDEQIRRLYIFGEGKRFFMHQAARQARARGDNGKWVRLLEKSLARSRWIEAHPGWYKIRCKFALRSHLRNLIHGTRAWLSQARTQKPQIRPVKSA